MKRTDMLKKITVSALALMMTAGGASAFAHGNEHGKGHGNAYGLKGKYQIKVKFDDLGDRWEWAQENIARLASMQVFLGYDDGTFRPQQQVTRLEAIITAVRLMGLKDQAESQAEMSAHLNFKDADEIAKKYPQAVGYVAVAAEHDLFNETENSLQPDKPATRLWIATMLVKALGLDAEAQSKINTTLTFKDAKAIPAGSVGYVEEAVEKKIVYGYNDNTFRPNQPVTRAEIAAFLDRAGMQLPDYQDGDIQGTVTAVSGNVLTLQVDGQIQTYSIDPNAFVFRNGAKVAISTLAAGDQVSIRTYNQVVIFIEVTQNADTGTTQPTQPTQPTVNYISENVQAAVSNNTLYLTKNGTNEHYAIASDALIFRDGKQASWNDLVVGDTVTVRLENNIVKMVIVTNDATPATFTTAGLLQSITLNSDGKIATISIKQNVNGSDQVSLYNVASNVTVDGNMTQLVYGSAVVISGQNNLISKITVN